MGRFSAIDIFHTKGRNKAYDWIIYFGLLLVFIGIYTLVASWRLIVFKCKRTKSVNGLILSGSELIPETAESDSEDIRMKKSQLLMEEELLKGKYFVKI
jgi:hypothetical protein